MRYTHNNNIIIQIKLNNSIKTWVSVSIFASYEIKVHTYTGTHTEKLESLTSNKIRIFYLSLQRVKKILDSIKSIVLVLTAGILNYRPCPSRVSDRIVLHPGTDDLTPLSGPEVRHPSVTPTVRPQKWFTVLHKIVVNMSDLHLGLLPRRDRRLGNSTVVVLGPSLKSSRTSKRRNLEWRVTSVHVRAPLLSSILCKSSVAVMLLTLPLVKKKVEKVVNPR